jgi:hypothetical protein
VRRRDLYILSVVAAVIVFGGYWMLLLSPKRKDLSKLDKQVADKQQAVDDAKAKAQSYTQAKVNYRAIYASMAKLGKAAPSEGSVDDDVPSLLLQVNHGADITRTNFDTFTPADSGAQPSQSASSGGSAGTGTSGSSAPSAAGPGDGSGAQSGGDSTAAASSTLTLSQVGYSYSFEGSFYDLEDMINYLTNLVRVNGKRLKITGRLIAIQSIDFTLDEGGVKADIGVTSYTVPAGQSLLGGATPQGPAGSSGQQQASSSSDNVPGAPPQAQPATPPTAAVKRP